MTEDTKTETAPRGQNARDMAALEEYAKRWGWKCCGNFWDWITLRLVGYDRWEKELEADKLKGSQFTRWWYGSRMETMHKWMRENAPEDVKHAYFSIVANGSNPMFGDESLQIKGQDSKGIESLLEAADKAVARAQDLEVKLAHASIPPEPKTKHEQLDLAMMKLLPREVAAETAMDEIIRLRRELSIARNLMEQGAQKIEELQAERDSLKRAASDYATALLEAQQLAAQQ